MPASSACIMMAARMFRTWRDPLSVDNGNWVRHGVGIMLMEFMVVHSGGFIGAYAAGHVDSSPVALLLLSLFYAGFAALMAWVFKSRDLFKYFISLMGGRLLTVCLPVFRDDAAYLGSRAGVAVLLYICMAFLTVFPLPRGGITTDVADRCMKGAGGGIWVSFPHRPILAGAIYFFLMGCAELALPFGLLRMEFSSSD